MLGVDRGRYAVLVDEGGGDEREITAARASELRRKSVVTGDHVDLVGDTTGEPGTLARIVRIGERSTLLRRSADDTDEVERIIVANADQMLIVVAAANPEPRIRLVDRYLVAAFDAGIQPLLVITKTDLADPDRVPRELRRPRPARLPVEHRADAARGDHARARSATAPCSSGHSGVGKSTLVNALVPSADRAIGRVNEVTGRGRHTSSSTISLRVEDERGGTGWVIDTPGVRSFGLGHVDPANILGAFTDLARIAEDCPRGCTHLPDAPDCAMNEAVAAGELGETGRARLDSLQRLLATFA